MKDKECQIHSLNRLFESLSSIEVLWQRRNRLRRIINRRLNYLYNMLFKSISDGKMESSVRATNKLKSETLNPGDIVRVKSREEIQTTLNLWNQLKGCAFMEEMWAYCGTTQKVLKRVDKFLDERDYLMKKCNGIVILDGVFCEGTKDFGPCDRSCFFFWREEWLEKLN